MFMQRIALPLAISGLLLAASYAQEKAAWPQFRGADQSGVATSQSIPDEFGPEQNVLWRKKVSKGHSSPCIFGNRIFLTGAKGSDVYVAQYRRDNGELVWEKKIPMVREEKFGHPHATPAGSSPCTDGERVYAFFGSYGLVAMDMSGEILWKHTWPVRNNMYGTASSPILDGDSLFLVRDVSDISAVYCYDTKTGKQKWKTLRPEARVNYATPYVWRRKKRTEVIVAGSAILKSYDSETGKPLWWVHNMSVFCCPSPTASDDMLYYAAWSTPNEPAETRLASIFDSEDTGLPVEVLKDVDLLWAKLDQDDNGKLSYDEVPASRAKDIFKDLDIDKDGFWEKAEARRALDRPTTRGRNILVAIRPDGEGDITESHVVWEKRRGLPYVASPLLYNGRLYFVKKGGLFSCIDAKTGKGHYERKRLGVAGEYYATPIGVGNRVIVPSARGTVFVIDASSTGGDELNVVARNELGDGVYATPAIVDNTMYLRSSKYLWAIGKKDPEAKRDK